MHKRVLIANRGEIAIRIAKAASALGMESIGVYAPADSLSLHTRFTTEARRIGHDDGDPLSAYLDAEALVDTAVASGCDCVHPGYGFLSENPHLAKLCADAGLQFIGPSPEVLALFGDKVRARERARAAGIPVISGSDEPLATPEAAAKLAQSLGYPVMLKACAGGGGRGMRAVEAAADVEAAFESCQREAQVAFGDGRLFMEPLLQRPRHIEVQVIADTGGNVVHLHERDCSVQRRNQKVIETAPAAALAIATRMHVVPAATYYGALAVIDAGSRRECVSRWGMVLDQESELEAKRLAAQLCRTNWAHPDPIGFCRRTAYSFRHCGAVASGYTKGEFEFCHSRQGVGETKSSAEAEAIARCATRRQHCEIVGSGCNSTRQSSATVGSGQ